MMTKRVPIVREKATVAHGHVLVPAAAAPVAAAPVAAVQVAALWAASVLAAFVLALTLAGCGTTPISEPRERVDEIGQMTEQGQLTSILRDDGQPLNRAAAATVLGRLGDTAAVEPLIAGLKDDDAGVRRDCAHALGMLGDFRATPALGETLLEDRVVDVRRASARALHELGDPAATGNLVAALSDPNESVVYNAYRALVKITQRTDLGRSASEWAQLVPEEDQ